jgi:hypothetical protein
VKASPSFCLECRSHCWSPSSAKGRRLPPTLNVLLESDWPMTLTMSKDDCLVTITMIPPKNFVQMSCFRTFLLRSTVEKRLSSSQHDPERETLYIASAVIATNDFATSEFFTHLTVSQTLFCPLSYYFQAESERNQRSVGWMLKVLHNDRSRLSRCPLKPNYASPCLSLSELLHSSHARDGGTAAFPTFIYI